MTPRDFCQPHTAEPVKGCVHGVLFLAAGLCCAYNIAAYAFRRDRHLAVNSTVYGALLIYEAAKVHSHLR